MLRLLLDAHISSAVATRVRDHRPTCDIDSLAKWENGVYRTASGNVILKVAATRNLTFVTYDLRTIPPLLRRMAVAGDAHGGVVLVDQRTIGQADIGAHTRPCRTLG